jgi:hypothetical protein
MKNILKFKDLAIAFANNQKVTYYDDERELNQTCRIFALTEDSVSITNGMYQYDNLPFDKVDIREDYSKEEVYSIIQMCLGMKESGKTDIEIIRHFEQFKNK